MKIISRKLMAMMIAVVVVFALAACGGGNAGEELTDANEATETEAMEAAEETADTANAASADAGDVLIVYFSAANTKDADAVTSATPLIDDKGVMEWMADVIQDNVGGDMFRVTPSVDYPLEYRECTDKAKQEQNESARPELEPVNVDPTSYKTIFIGYPIWWGDMPMILETFFDTYDLSGATIIPFCTHEGSGDSGTYNDIRDREPNATVPEGLSMRGGSVGTDDSKAEIENWLSNLKLN